MASILQVLHSKLGLPVLEAIWSRRLSFPVSSLTLIYWSLVDKIN